MRRYLYACLVASIALLPIAACAATATQPDGVAAVDGAGALMGSKVVLPWGAYVSAFLGWADQFIVALGVALVAWAGRALPSWAVSLAKDYLTQQRIARAVNYALTQVDDAVKDKAVTLDAGNALVAIAERYVMTLAPQMAEQLGERLKPMILAQIAKIGVAPKEAVTHDLPLAPIPQTIK